MTPIVVTLPYPISANRYWRSYVPRGHKRAIVTLSDEAKAYKREVRIALREAGVDDVVQGRLAVHIQLYPKRPADWEKRARRDPLGWDESVLCIDLDNARKVLYDAMSEVVYVDDSQVWRDSGERMEPDEHGARVVVTISRIERTSPQASLIADEAPAWAREYASA